MSCWNLQSLRILGSGRNRVEERIRKVAARALLKVSSWHSPGEIQGKPWKTWVRMIGRNPRAYPLPIQSPRCYLLD